MFIEEKYNKFNQIVTFDNNTKCCIDNIVKVKVGNMVHLLTEDNTEYIINPSRVLYVEVIPIQTSVIKTLPTNQSER